MIVVPFAFLMSALLASAIVISLSLEQLTRTLHTAGDDSEIVVVMFHLLSKTATLLPALTLIPALAVVIIGEVARIRSSLYYIVGGGAALASIPLLAQLGPLSEAAPALDQALWHVFATAGFAGGALYWLIAGRNA